jgi:hypothetical protein
MSDWFWRQGDTASDFTETLRDETGDAVDIGGASVHLTMTSIRGGAPAIDASMDNLQSGDGSDGSKGVVSYTPQPGDTDVPGDYLAAITVTYTGGAVETFPNSGYILITITPTAAAQQRRYVGIEEFKKTLELAGTSFIDYDADIAIEAASRGVEEAFGGPWTLGPDGEERYYTRATPRELSLGDAIKITSIDLDFSLDDVYLSAGSMDDDWPFAGGGGTYSTNLPSSSYMLLPVNPKHGLVADGGNGEPYRSLMLSRGAVIRRFPRGTGAIRVTGQFGWETVPAGVKWTVQLLATRLIRRTREAPFGIIALGLEGAVARVREMTRDPDVIAAMRGVSGRKRLVV